LGDGWQRSFVTPCKFWLEWVQVLTLFQLSSILLSLVAVAVAVTLVVVVAVQAVIALAHRLLCLGL
jgi:hypothetical protein